MSRAIRDPIHGNVPVKDIAGAVIDTLAFQRLRYVRQNGLLHFVFPGATHTRFAHSIGAMHVAARVWHQLSKNFAPSKQRHYVGVIFELAALLHDVGHCAFSHSIESVQIKGKPLLGSVEEFFASWKEPELLAAYINAKAAKLEQQTKQAVENIAKEDVKHEQIGLILAKRIFAEPKVSDVCKASLGVPGPEVGADVIALMQLGMPATKNLTDALGEVASTRMNDSYVNAKANEFARDMLPVLAGLISGTLDVDRMDYLLRDSFYCGVSYGRIDIEHIIAGLGLATFKGRTYLTVKEKTVLAIDDLLWSRHQMFLQVYGHKTNVALNRTLQLALPDMMGDLQELNPPAKDHEYLEFTDDFVLSKIFSLCFRDKRLGTTNYARLLARREVPEHLGELRLPTVTTNPNASEVVAASHELAKKRGVEPSKVLFAPTANEIVKKGLLPSVIVDGRSGEVELVTYQSKSSLFPIADRDAPAPLPARYVVWHFFTDRSAPLQAADPTVSGASAEKISPKNPESLPKIPAARTAKKK